MNLPRCETCDMDLHGRDVVFDGVDSRCRKCNNPVLLDDARVKRDRKRKRKSDPEGVPAGVSVRRQTADDGSITLHLQVPWYLQRPDDGLHLTGWILVATTVLGALELGLSKPIAFASGAFLLLCAAALRRVNRTSIRVSEGNIRISHTPVPWRWHSINPGLIEQLYVIRRPIAQRVFDYGVRARLRDDRDVSFFRGIREPSVAFYLERCIEEHFHIKDRRVRGEFTQPPPEPPKGPYLD